jgi:magnesium chelatase subunit D
MNIEEGSLRPQLLDRFALSLDIETPRAARDRALIVESRLQFDASPVSFCARYEAEQHRFRLAIAEARALIPGIQPSAAILEQISQAVIEAGVCSLRADLATLRAAIAHAALAGNKEVTHEDIHAVLALVLHHRSKRDPAPSKAPPSHPQPTPGEAPREAGEGQPESRDRVFPPEAREAPEIRLALADAIARGRGATVKDRTTAEAIRAEGAANGESLDVVSSLTRSFRNTGIAALQSEQLVFRPPHARSGVRFIFVVDASGSQAAHQRMRAVKGVALALLESSVDKKDEVTVISFRGPKAEVVLEPCRDVDAAQRALEFIPTGGRTPLAHALELAGSLVNSASLLVLLTDGRANVPLTSADPWADALAAAQRLACAAVVVDSSVDGSGGNSMDALASALRATLIRLDDLSNEALMHILKR